MEELFINKTKCTQKEYIRFQNSYKREYAVSELVGMFIYVVFFLFCIIFAFANKEIRLGLVLLVAFILYLIYKLFIKPRRIKKQEESNKIKDEYVNTYTFYKHYFKTESPEGTAQTFYMKIYKIIETKTNFYIYLARDYAFILSKDGFEDNKCEEFKEFIKKKVRLKYKLERSNEFKNEEQNEE